MNTVFMWLLRMMIRRYGARQIYRLVDRNSPMGTVLYCDLESAVFSEDIADVVRHQLRRQADQERYEN